MAETRPNRSINAAQNGIESRMTTSHQSEHLARVGGSFLAAEADQVCEIDAPHHEEQADEHHVAPGVERRGEAQVQPRLLHDQVEDAAPRKFFLPQARGDVDQAFSRQPSGRQRDHRRQHHDHEKPAVLWDLHEHRVDDGPAERHHEGRVRHHARPVLEIGEIADERPQLGPDGARSQRHDNAHEKIETEAADPHDGAQLQAEGGKERPASHQEKTDHRNGNSAEPIR